MPCRYRVPGQTSAIVGVTWPHTLFTATWRLVRDSILCVYPPFFPELFGVSLLGFDFPSVENKPSQLLGICWRGEDGGESGVYAESGPTLLSPPLRTWLRPTEQNMQSVHSLLLVCACQSHLDTWPPLVPPSPP